ncbi:hypothetical protein [Bradyrhizobium frederickii]|uniref:hypothetical protein n=1 Tax=Bradyrhizobium frederickii TaxID=2560054 RepID=UPI001F4058A5|nr:hypothetical protein [Bradyrhizobium frederickii]
MKNAESRLGGNRGSPLVNATGTGQPRNCKRELSMPIDLVNTITLHSEIHSDPTTKKAVAGGISVFDHRGLVELRLAISDAFHGLIFAMGKMTVISALVVREARAQHC